MGRVGEILVIPHFKFLPSLIIFHLKRFIGSHTNTFAKGDPESQWPPVRSTRRVISGIHKPARSLDRLGVRQDLGNPVTVLISVKPSQETKFIPHTRKVLQHNLEHTLRGL